MKTHCKRNNDSIKKNILGRTIAFFCILLLTSCSSLVKDPKVHLERVEVRDANIKGANLIFILDVENPNDYEIKIDEVQYKVFLGDKYFASAKTPKPVAVAASSKTSVELPLPVEYSKIIGGIGDLLTGQSLAYKVEGAAKLSFLGLRIPFDESGSFDLGLSGLKEKKD